MILLFIGTVLVTVLNFVFSILGHVDTLPFGMDDVLVQAFGAFFGFKAIFWPLDIVWTCFTAYIGIQLTLWILRLLRIIR
jgi:hypothetical protein